MLNIQLNDFTKRQNPNFTFSHSAFCMFYELFAQALAKFPQEKYFLNCKLSRILCQFRCSTQKCN